MRIELKNETTTGNKRRSDGSKIILDILVNFNILCLNNS